MYAIEWRNVMNDVAVTPWRLLTEEAGPVHEFDSPFKALKALMSYVPVQRTGFSEDDGLHTGRGYGEATLFEAVGYPQYQYRIVKLDLLEGVLLVRS